jgi:hypothetical protein
MAVPETGQTPFDGLFPALIQWDSAPPELRDTGVRLEALRLRTPEAAALRAVLGPLIRDMDVEILDADAPGMDAVLRTPDGMVTL